MSLTADALWLNSFFSWYDNAILSLAHKLAEWAGSVLTPFNRFVTFMGELGLLFILLALVMLLFPRWRRAGVCVLFSILVGALITNLLLKNQVARPRPFEASELFREWWQFVGAPAESGYSFPSGHVTAAAAGVSSLCLIRGRRWFIPGAIWVLLMMFSRNYLMAHYPSDVLFALFIGIFSGFIAAAITHLVFSILEKRSGDGGVCDFLLETGFEELPSPATLKEKLSAAKSAAEPSSGSAHTEKSSRHVANKITSRSVRARSSSSAGSSNYQGKH